MPDYLHNYLPYLPTYTKQTYFLTYRNTSIHIYNTILVQCLMLITHRCICIDTYRPIHCTCVYLLSNRS